MRVYSERKYDRPCPARVTEINVIFFDVNQIGKLRRETHENLTHKEAFEKKNQLRVSGILNPCSTSIFVMNSIRWCILLLFIAFFIAYFGNSIPLA